ncbi:MAG: arginyl-tRNA synthetase [Gammaproteobacteria bacterium]
MKLALEQLLTQALDRLTELGFLPTDGDRPPLLIERCRDASHGDFACPVAMSLARIARRAPREIAAAIVDALPANDFIEGVDIAGPGFINFRFAPAAFHALVGTILNADKAYGRSSTHAGRRVQVEFVSANPTGPLHVGHGRGAAYGAVVAQLLRAVGCEVECEYYVNDAGRQMDILGVSVWLRYLGRDGAQVPFPANAYQGDYISDIARALATRPGLDLDAPLDALPVATDDAEQSIDALIDHARTTLGATNWRTMADHALDAIRGDIEDDLADFGVNFDVWFSERSLVTSGALARALEQLDANGHTYEQGGAVWFRSTTFGDEKDRVLVRENGQSTYFASDVAYHLNKLERGFDELIDVWGADHHGYISRVRGSLEGLGREPSALRVLLVQFANLFRGGEKVAMSTRSGQFVTLRELRHEVGRDAARFFYIVRKSDQHLDFDLDLAKSRSNENPVYYIQYAFARVASVLRELADKGTTWSDDQGIAAASGLTQPHEIALLKTLGRYPEVVENAAMQHEPHQVAFYLRDVANDFHTYYNAHKFLVDDLATRDARIGLARATQTVIRNGLGLLGVSAPESM